MSQELAQYNIQCAAASVRDNNLNKDASCRGPDASHLNPARPNHWRAPTASLPEFIPQSQCGSSTMSRLTLSVRSLPRFSVLPERHQRLAALSLEIEATLPRRRLEGVEPSAKVVAGLSERFLRVQV
jgi:hypothetical protein